MRAGSVRCRESRVAMSSGAVSLAQDDTYRSPGHTSHANRYTPQPARRPASLASAWSSCIASCRAVSFGFEVNTSRLVVRGVTGQEHFQIGSPDRPTPWPRTPRRSGRWRGAGARDVAVARMLDYAASDAFAAEVPPGNDAHLVAPCLVVERARRIAVRRTVLLSIAKPMPGASEPISGSSAARVGMPIT